MDFSPTDYGTDSFATDHRFVAMPWQADQLDIFHELERDRYDFVDPVQTWHMFGYGGDEGICSERPLSLMLEISTPPGSYPNSPSITPLLSTSNSFDEDILGGDTHCRGTGLGGI
jgi:hypothetical protein